MIYSLSGHQQQSHIDSDIQEVKFHETTSDGSSQALDRMDRVKRIQQDSCNDKEEIDFLKRELE